MLLCEDYTGNLPSGSRFYQSMHLSRHFVHCDESADYVVCAFFGSAAPVLVLLVTPRRSPPLFPKVHTIQTTHVASPLTGIQSRRPMLPHHWMPVVRSPYVQSRSELSNISAPIGMVVCVQPTYAKIPITVHVHSIPHVQIEPYYNCFPSIQYVLFSILFLVVGSFRMKVADGFPLLLLT